MKINLNREEILVDFKIAVSSREASILGRKEVFMGKAKFGIFGDGKEVAQLAMARSFQNGDFRSGYYRDQTFMFAIGELTIEQYFAQLYAHMDIENEPASAGRMMNGHFGTRSLNIDGTWKDLTKQKNSSSDVSPTGSQMPRLLGLAQASKYYRSNENVNPTGFSINGNEIAFGTIGNASTSEGMFYETINAAGVLGVPMLISVWDDEYGISVSKEYHTVKGSISEVLKGFKRKNNKGQGYEIFTVKGWDYENLILTYQKAAEICRAEHCPVLIHVEEMTQPQGHSTSGSHERYKSKERLEWENEWDCIQKMRQWIIENEILSIEEVEKAEKEAIEQAKSARKSAWENYVSSMKKIHSEAIEILSQLLNESANKTEIESIFRTYKSENNPIIKDAISSVKKALRYVRNEQLFSKNKALDFIKKTEQLTYNQYSSFLYSESELSATKIKHTPAVYNENSKKVDGREVLQACFDAILDRDQRVLAFGEDVGKIGDVNQAFAGLQEKHGESRVFDTGIRECTIIGQGIGLAMRGLRPIAEIQYLDYLLYAIQIMSDDLSTVQWRTKGGQKAPLIIRTRGHRLEGVWHSGSPMGMILNACRGLNILVPRNMTQAAGFYNTMLLSDEPALIIECLNGYRLKEIIPENISEFTVPLGTPEIIKVGEDVTIVTYGSMCRVVTEAANDLAEFGISVEIIDVQTLIPFDIHHTIVESIKKTNRVIFADEDVSGGASAYMMQKVLEEQKAYFHLDSEPITIHAKDHRPAYATDGDYFSKPNTEEIFDTVYELIRETNPNQFPKIY